MATYDELRQRFDGPLAAKVTVAVVEAARIIADGEDTADPFDQATGMHDARLVWARRAIVSTREVARNVLKMVLVKNKNLDAAQIDSAGDAAVQTAVNEVVDLLAREYLA